MAETSHFFHSNTSSQPLLEHTAPIKKGRGSLLPTLSSPPLLSHSRRSQLRCFLLSTPDSSPPPIFFLPFSHLTLKASHLFTHTSTRYIAFPPPYQPRTTPRLAKSKTHSQTRQQPPRKHILILPRKEQGLSLPFTFTVQYHASPPAPACTSTSFPSPQASPTSPQPSILDFTTTIPTQLYSAVLINTSTDPKNASQDCCMERRGRPRPPFGHGHVRREQEAHPELGQS